MKLFLSNLSVILVFISCNTTSSHNASLHTDSIKPSTIKITETVKPNSTIKNLPAPKGYKIILPNCYRLYDYDPTKCLSEDWLELFEENGAYFLDKPMYAIENSYDECAQIASKCIHAKRKTILFIKNPALETGMVTTTYPITKDILPTSSVMFSQHEQSYSVKVNSTVKENMNADDNWKSYSNLQLCITKINGNGFEDQNLLHFDSLAMDSYFKVLFAGDLNRDGKCDFIIQASTFYEEYTVYVYLSNKSETTPFYDLYAKLLYQFDC